MRSHNLYVKSFLTLTVVVILIIIAAKTANAHPAWGIVVSSTGTVYFSDLETIWKIDPAGKLTVVRPGLSGRHVHELSIDEHDNLYGPDFSYVPATQKWLNAIWKMTPDGALTYLQQPTENTAPGMSIWLDRAGNMYSVDQNNHTKTRTLVLKRTPAGVVSTLAGGAYGHADGSGTAARFSSVGAIYLGVDGNLYLSDGEYVRRVSMDGTVVTLAKNLLFRTAEDKPPLFAGSYGSLAGLAVDRNGNVYVADAGDRRLLKISNVGKVSVVYRCDPPFFPNGVFATPAGDVYVLEFSFTPPGTWGGPRVRKITRDGKNDLLSTDRAGVAFVISPSRGPLSLAERVRSLVNVHLILVVLSAGLVMAVLIFWRRSQTKRSI